MPASSRLYPTTPGVFYMGEATTDKTCRTASASPAPIPAEAAP